MSWDQIFGHDHLVDRFRTAVVRERLGSAFLFVGPDGIGKRRFALELATALLCERNPESELNACGQCEACQMVAAGSHPDLFTIEKPDDKASIPVELIIGDRDHRNRKGRYPSHLFAVVAKLWSSMTPISCSRKRPIRCLRRLRNHRLGAS